MYKKLLILLPTIFLFGCDETNRVEELRVQIEQKKLNTVVNIPPPPELKKFEVYNYQNAGLKSPFRNSISELKTEKKSFTDIKPDNERTKEELESYELVSIKMTGTINKSDEQLEAILETENGKIFVVKNGNYIGKNNGKILKINKDKIEIEEIIANGSYRWQKRPATITMHSTN
jgi:type IV pilus assembly protein PilP